MSDIDPFVKARAEILDRIETMTKSLTEAKATLAEADIQHAAARAALQAAVERAETSARSLFRPAIPGVILRNIAETVGDDERQAAGAVGRLKQQVANLEWDLANMTDALAQVERAINPPPMATTGPITHEVTEEVDWTANGWPEVVA